MAFATISTSVADDEADSAATQADGMSETWSKPYYGVQHFGECSTRSTWATVVDHGSFATCTVWFPGCGFRPTETQHEDAAAARAHAEERVGGAQ